MTINRETYGASQVKTVPDATEMGWYGMVWGGLVWYGVVRGGMGWYSMNQPT